MGGLGNQMFQYALGYHLAQKNNTILKVDTTLLTDKSQPHEIVTHRNLEIDIFDIPLNFATQEEIEYFNGKKYTHPAGKVYNKITRVSRKKNLIIEKGRNFHPEMLALPDNKCLVGSWQSEKYFTGIESKIRELYAFNKPLSGKPLELGNEITKTNSACIHIRRGDYITSTLYTKTLGVQNLDYYYRALELLTSKQAIERVFVFSDDIEWCKNNLNLSVPVTYMDYTTDGKKYATDMQLMGLCKHFIIANSTFSWWAAWLANFTGKMVIAPTNWYKDPALDSTDIIPSNWIKI